MPVIRTPPTTPQGCCTPTSDMQAQLTTVRSTLVGPDGRPLAGREVVAVLRASPTWLEDGTGRVIDTARTRTDVQARRSTRQDYRVTGPDRPDPDLTVSADPGDTRRATAVLELEYTTPSRGDIEVDWGDGTPTELVQDPDPGTVLRHRYTSEGTFLVLCSYTSAPGQATAKAVQVPFPTREQT